MSPFFLPAYPFTIKGASHNTMKNTQGEREGGRQPRPRNLPNGVHGGIQIRTYPPHRHNAGKISERLRFFPAYERLL